MRQQLRTSCFLHSMSNEPDDLDQMNSKCLYFKLSNKIALSSFAAATLLHGSIVSLRHHQDVLWLISKDGRYVIMCDIRSKKRLHGKAVTLLTLLHYHQKSSLITITYYLPKDYSGTPLVRNILLPAASDLTRVLLNASLCTCPGRVQANPAGPDGLQCNLKPSLLSQDVTEESGNGANRATRCRTMHLVMGTPRAGRPLKGLVPGVSFGV